MTDVLFLEKIKDILLAQKKEILSHILDHDIDVDGDDIDLIQGNILLGIQKQLNIRNNLKIKKIDKAIKQVEDKTYGVCEDCGDQIPQKRLLINPYTTICVDCAEERELQEKNKKELS